jgi:type II secretory pathway predicted ATPase ExeA
MNRNQLSHKSLKWNPFSPELPREALITTPRIEHFAWRVENLAREGGFALIEGGVGEGKSVALRLVAERLMAGGEITVGELTRPHARAADFYRELGHLFGVELRPHNRWAGSKALRERWIAHLDSVRMRPVLLVDEAQEMQSSILAELRLLASSSFDTRNLLTVVLCGDRRLRDKLGTPELLPILSRIRARLAMEPISPLELVEHLRVALATAGNPQLMTSELIATLAEHSAGNWRTLMNMGNELLAAAVHQDVAQLDEKLYLEVFAAPQPQRARRPSPARGGGK